MRRARRGEEALVARRLERSIGRVHRVGLTSHQPYFYVDHRIARDHTTRERSLHTLLHRADELPRHGASHHGVFEDEARAARKGLDVQDGHAELSMTARLLLLLALHALHGAGD